MPLPSKVLSEHLRSPTERTTLNETRNVTITTCFHNNQNNMPNKCITELPTLVLDFFSWFGGSRGRSQDNDQMFLSRDMLSTVGVQAPEGQSCPENWVGNGATISQRSISSLLSKLRSCCTTLFGWIATLPPVLRWGPSHDPSLGLSLRHLGLEPKTLSRKGQNKTSSTETLRSQPTPNPLVGPPWKKTFTCLTHSLESMEQKLTHFNSLDSVSGGR